MKKSVLIVDDEQAVCWALERALARDGYTVSVAASAEQALARLAKQPADVIFLDVRLPGMDGLTAMPRMKQCAPEAAVIIATAFGSLPTAVQAVEGGAFDYLAKPFDLAQALDAVRRALTRRPASEPVPEAAPVGAPEEIVGISPVMQQVFKRIALVAPHDACVLITGESGTGKELVARAVHRYGARRDQPFLPVHIAALNAGLVESELLGHARGAFTGATGPRTGLLALAGGGTVFLDELGDIPMPVQVKLLRALEHQEVLPVGASQPVALNLRILAATNIDLQRRIAEGTFRLDLYFRLNVFQIHLPPLRERPEDILPLAEHFLRRFRPAALPLAAETLTFLQRRPWYGNVRELRNALEHAAIVARDEPLAPGHFPGEGDGLGPRAEEDLPACVRRWLAERVRSADAEGPRDLHEALLAAIEPALLEDVMKRLRGNRWAAAQWLGLNRATVRKKLAHYGLAGVDGDEDREPGGP